MISFDKYTNIPFFQGSKIIDIVTLSNSFGVSCSRIELEDNKYYVLKELMQESNGYNSVYYEGKCLEFMNSKFPDIFPRVFYLKETKIVLEYIDHNNIKNNQSEQNLAYHLSRIHKIKNDKFGYDFDTPIGGLKQPSRFEKSWVDFYGNNRLGMIFEIINATNPMPNEINKGIENLLKNLKNFIPNSPQPSLIHGDMWEGNILFQNGEISGFIDPGIYFAHCEMEIAYLEWFKYISKNFYKYYSEYNYLDKDYTNYSEIYQLYYCLLNVHLWSRDYIKNTLELVRKFI